LHVLVCGGAGYIGSHTVRRLQQAGFEVLVIDNLVKGHRPAIGDIPFINADITSKRDLKQVFSSNKIEAVIHFAANSLVGESMIKPGPYYLNNFVGTLNLLEIMLEAGVRYIIFSSTAAVYGEPVEVPIGEGHTTIPTNPYGATKLAVEGMLKWFGEAYGLKYISLRYFNAAGADPDGDIGEDHTPETHLIPLAIKTALGLLPTLNIWGAGYPTRDGTCIRDYIHVNDLADAHVLALNHLARGSNSAVYNLGNGNGFSVREVIRAVEEVGGRPVKVVEKESRPGDPAVLVASAAKAKRELGWTPRHSRLNDIISTAWYWHSRHPNGFSNQ